MRWRTVLRVSPASWLLLPMVAAAWAYARTIVAEGVSADPYPLAWTAAGEGVLVWVASACAGLCAWEGGRLRRARWWDKPHARSKLTIAAWSCALPWTVGMCAMLLATGYLLLQRGVHVPDWRVLGLIAIQITCYSLLGFALGVWLPLVLSVPLSMLLVWTWLALPVGMEPVWLRHLNGSGLFLCCSAEWDLAPKAVLAMVLVTLGVGASAMVLMTIARWRWLAVVPLAIALALAVPLVRGFGYVPVVARDPSLLRCAGSQPRVCVWPEHAGMLPRILSMLAQAREAWASQGVNLPDTLTEGQAKGPGEAEFDTNVKTDDVSLKLSLASAVVGADPNCESEEAFDAGMRATFWLGVKAGIPISEIAKRYQDPSTFSEIRQVSRWSPQEQASWLREQLAAARSCGPTQVRVR